MTLMVSILAFLSVSLLIFWVATRKDTAARRRVRTELIDKAMMELRQQDQVNDQTLLRDESLSGFGLLDRALDRMKLAANLRKLIEQADLNIRVGTLVLATLVFGIVGFLVAKMSLVPVALSLAIGATLAVIPYTYVLVVRKRRMKRFETLFPDSVDLMSRAIRAGHAFNTGIKMVADEMPDPVGKEFRRVHDEQNMGMPLRDALQGLIDRIELVDLKLFVVAVLIQRQSGGNLAEILDKIAYTIRERFRILRQLRVHTAQAKLTGLVLTVLPPVTGGIIYWLNYDYMKIIFEEQMGIYVLVYAALLQLAGFVWIRKIVNIEV